MLPGVVATKLWGGKLATAIAKNEYFITRGATIYLSGDLGSGKTTLVQGLLSKLGVTGAIQSPTFNLIHTYSIPPIEATHVDLYRITNPIAAATLDLELYHERPMSILAIEWAENGLPVIPKADIQISMDENNRGNGRVIILSVINSAFSSVISEM
ncbi:MULTISPECIES: tRNA (adenosine(37)-N6)-threonylcarbamoyltransferase complex ATPase subunit type 1 TsaE [Candidatus Ichthyocystis]|nr:MULTISPECIES: tRNA (adenosine(37)-N6)-threonylcarbamoyltransferase complex ATPase subunit type 1 TsaE [Ichthyocystis]